ncbi:MAG TPA: TfpX/TfpZ family type IV pilin accessory protein [Dyella sp.]|uniref:TfpX/TfpZ family type IV pilin accessory protein n=1 Tax=Dyella sp. TaxID=1869338 RepID=UPI002CC578AE|nr:TfpX/TfpZ family type IV pilin accessory protein [Dyella sp.]HTV86376.1 TfpX/TfpZ family type IV pilin accessory protein [Dyella sp.]
MNRWKAAAVHLSISFVLAALIGSLLYFVWFPAPYFVAAGGGGLILLLMGVDIAIGPLITLLVVSRNKARKLLLMDLSIIGVLQIVALGYGLYVITDARPVFIVAEVDRLTIVSAQDLSDADLAKGDRQAFRTRSWTGPRLVGAVTPKGKDAGDFVMKVLASGKDIDRMPRFYRPYDEVIDEVMKKYAKPLASLKKATQSQRAYLDRLQAQTPGQTLLVLPLQRGDSSYSAIMSPVSKRPIAVLPIDPW